MVEIMSMLDLRWMMRSLRKEAWRVDFSDLVDGSWHFDRNRTVFELHGR